MNRLLLIILILSLDISKGYSQTGKVKQDTLQAQSLLEKVGEFRQEHNPDSAIKYLERAADIYQKHNLWDHYLPLVAETGYWYLELAAIDSARANFHRGDDLLENNLVSDTIAIIDFLGYKGYLYFIVQELDSGVLNTQKNLQLTQSFYRDEPNAALVNAYSRLATSYYNLHDFDLALKYYDSALQVLNKIDAMKSQTAANIYYNIADLYQFIGDFNKAIEYDQMSLEILKELLEPGHYFIMDTYLSLAYCFASRNDSPNDNYQALEFLEDVREMSGGTFPDPGFGLYVLSSAGLAYKNLDQFDSAISYFQKGAELIKNHYGDDHPDLGNMYQNLGNIYTERQDFEQGQLFFQKAITLYRDHFGPQYREVSMSRQMLGDSYLKQNEYMKAAVTYHQALANLLPELPQNQVLAVPNQKNIYLQPALLSALRRKSESLYICYQKKVGNRDYLEAAVETYQMLLASLEKYKKGLVHQENKLEKTEEFHEVFENALEATLELYRIKKDKSLLEKSLQIVESQKASVLVSDLQDLRGRTFSNIPDSLQKQEKLLKLSIRFTEQQLYEMEISKQPDQSSIKILKDKLFLLRREFETLVKNLEYRYPNYFEYKYSTDTLQLAQIQSELLGDNEAMLEFFLTDRTGYIFLIGKNNLEVVQFANDSTLTASIIQLSNIAKLNQPREFSVRSHQLYQQLLAPVFEKIDQWSTSISHLLVIPDDAIGYLPFEILVTNRSESITNFKELPYLIKQVALSYHYSIRLLTLDQPKISDNDDQFDVLAVAPSFSRVSNPLLATRSASDQQLFNQLDALPQAQEEVNFISNILPGKMLIGDEATEQNFKKFANDYQVLHLASHTLINDEKPMFSRLVFSQKDSVEDGLLHTYELFNMDLNADLVCLSACNTGIGKIYQGEGVISLGRGFFYAGVSNILMSLWSVPDFSTANLMRNFYQEIASGSSYSESLRSAKLKFLQEADENTANPYFWGAFVMVGTQHQGLGNGTSGNDKYIWYWIFGSLVFITAVFLILKQRSS